MARWHIEDAEVLLKNAENMLNSIEKQEIVPLIPLSNVHRKNFKGRILANYALIASYHENTEDIIKYVEQALVTLSKDQIIWRNLATMIRSDAHFILGKLQEAHKGQVETNKSYQIAQNPFLYLMSGANLLVTLRQQGKLHEVLQLSESFIEYGTNNGLKNTSVIGWIQTIKGEVLAELNHLEQAEKIALQGVTIAESFKITGVLLKCYLLLIRIFFSEKKYSEIHKVVQKLEAESISFGITRHIKNQIDAWRDRISLSQNQFEQVEQWLQEYESRKDTHLHYIHENKHIAALRAYIALGKFNEAEQLLEQLKPETEKHDRINSLLEILLIQIHIKHQLKEPEMARKYFLEALSLAEANGYVRMLLEEGSDVESLLKEIQQMKRLKSSESLDSVSSEYVDMLVRSFEREKKAASVRAEEVLSSRELDTLKLIAEDLTNQEIADALYISLATVKTHVRNILLKLEAKNRSQAVSKAREKLII